MQVKLAAAALLGLTIGFSWLTATGQAFPPVSPMPTATPTPTVTPLPTGSPTPTVTPLPTASPTPQLQTIETLQAAIRQRVYGSDVRRGRVGVKIVSLTTGKVIFENDADKYFMPASNMKNFTVAAALERLGPEFRFVTSVFSAVPIDDSGTVKGDLRIYGRGDISISTAFFGTTPSDPETYYKGIDRLVDTIITAGVKRVDGTIIGDDSYFRGFAIPGSWEWDDLGSYYGAEVTALPVNDNAVDVFVRPGGVGGACSVTILPANSLMRFNNLCITTAAAVKSGLRVTKQLDRNILDIRGTLAAGASPYSASISITRPGELFVALLQQRLEARGVSIGGAARMQNGRIAVLPTQIEIARLESVPFAQIAAGTMKPSQNMYAETLLWTLGEFARSRTSYPAVGGVTGGTADSSVLGIGEVKTFLTGIGIPTDGISQYDGSGLSRHNLITPSAVVTLYSYMTRHSKHAQVWRDSLTIGGVDGTLKNRFKGTAAAANFRGKTGTIDQVSALSGYLTTAAGEHLVVSILVNGVSVQRMRTGLIDDIVVRLANYTGKID